MIRSKGNITGTISSKQYLKGKLNNGIEYVHPVLENLNVKPAGKEQIFNHPDSYGYDVVTVEPVSAEQINITPSTEEQTKEGLFNKVTVTGDSNLIPENIKEGVNIFDVVGTSSGADINEYFVDNVPDEVEEIVKYCIKKIPMIDTSERTSMDYTFAYCSNLEEIPLLDTSNVETMTYMFDECNKLKEIPLLDTSNVTDMGWMFRNCKSLTKIPKLNTSMVKSFRQMFSGCNNLIEIPVLDASKVTNINAVLTSCSKLTTFGGFANIGKAYPTTLGANNSMGSVGLTSCRQLTHESLINVFNNLYDIASIGVATQKVNLGSINIDKVTPEDILIATNKGWTVA